MKKTDFQFLPLVVSLSAVFAGGFSTNSLALSLDERVERLERMANNPVILRMSQEQTTQQREIQEIQNRMDLLQYEMQKNSGGSDSSAELDLLKNQLADLRLQQERQAQAIAALEDAIKVILGTSVKVPVAPNSSDSMQTVPVVSESSVLPAATQTVLQTAPQMVTQPTLVTTPPSPINSAGVTGQPTPSADKVELKGPVKTRLATDFEDKAYQQAFELMRKAKYAESVQAFEAFAQEYPESSLAPNAWYWAGEGYYIQSDYSGAKNAFERVVLLYPGESKESDAKLRLADALSNLSEPEKAKELYQAIIAKFPNSRAAENAKARLAKLL